MKRHWFFEAVSISIVFAGVTQATLITADADGYENGQDISDLFGGIALSAIGRAVGLDGRVYAYPDPLATTGAKVFGHNLSNHTEWYFDGYPESYHHPADFALRIDFLNRARMISIDTVCDSEFDIAQMVAYDRQGTVLESIWSYPGHLMSYGDIWTARITSESYDIAYVIVGGFYGNMAHAVVLDNLTADVIPEPATVLMLGLGGMMLLRRKSFTRRR